MKKQEEIIEGTAFVEALDDTVRVVIILPPDEDEDSTIYWYYDGERYESKTEYNREFVDMTRDMGKAAMIGLAAHIAGIAISEGRW